MKIKTVLKQAEKELMIKKIFAQLSYQSKQICGDDSMKKQLYLDLLKNAGIETYKIFLPKKHYESFTQKAKINAMKITKEAVVDHQVYVEIEIPTKGLSDLTKREISQIV